MFMKSISKMVLGLAATALLYGSLADPSIAQDGTPAKQLFGAVQLPNAASPAPLGFYAKGCMTGAVALPTDGPTWQAMRLSRNRRWGNPAMIATLEQVSRDAARIGWGAGEDGGGVGHSGRRYFPTARRPDDHRPCLASGRSRRGHLVPAEAGHTL